MAHDETRPQDTRPAGEAGAEEATVAVAGELAEEPGSSGTALVVLRSRLGARRGELAAFALLPVVLIGLLLLLTNLKTEGTAAFRDPGWDRHLYIAMARGGALDFHLAPYCWRVLVPLIAGAAPVGLQPAFLTICLLSLLGFGVALAWLYRAAGFSPVYAASGVLLVFSLGWGVKFVLADFWIPDATAFCCVTVALALAASRRPAPFAIALAIGVLVKESVIFALPLLYTLNASRVVDRPLVLRTLAAGAPAMALLVLLRLTIAQDNSDGAYIATLPEQISRFPELFPRYDYLSLMHHIGYEQRWQHLDLDAVLDATVRSFGVALPLLALGSLPRHWRLALRLLPFFVLVYAQLLFATDTQRLLVLGAPVAGWLALHGCQDLVGRLRIAPGAFVLLGALLFALLLFDADTYEVGALPQLGAIAVWAAGVCVIALFRGRGVAGARAHSLRSRP